MTTDPSQTPSREEMQARMDALMARLPARRSRDMHEWEARINGGMTKVEELESLARLAALDARVRAMGDPDDVG